MKQFLIKLCFFCFSMLAILFLLDIFISNRLKSSPNVAQGEYSVWNDIYKGKLNSDMLVYGSSRAWVHISPDLLSKAFNISCYNMGIDGHEFQLQYFRHREMLRFNKWPKAIIHSVDISFFTKEAQLYNYEQFLPYMLFNENIRTGTRQYDGFEICDFILPGVRFFGKKKLIDDAFKRNTRMNYSKEGRTRGYRAIEREWNYDLETAKKSMKDLTINIDSNIIRQFEQYLIECKENKATVILVYSPEYIDGQKFVKNRKEVIQVFNNISKKFQIPFYNYSNDSISYQKKYFYNSMHLNKTGSILFTNLLIADLKKDNRF